VVTHQLQVERRTAKAHRPKTDALPLDHATNYLPNVKKLTAVEPDADQMAAFKTRVAQLLPDVDTDFCQETAQSWKGSDQPFDAVMLFHCLYYIPLSERPALFNKLFDNVVANGGLVFIIISPCDILENPTDNCRFIDLLGIPSYNFVTEDIDGVRVRDIMTSTGPWHNCVGLYLRN